MSKAAFERMCGGRFLVLGRAGMDLCPDPPESPVDSASRYMAALGGAAAHIAAAIARLGGSASLISAIADDAVGRFVRNRLHAYRIGVEYVRSVSGARNSLALMEPEDAGGAPVVYNDGVADFELDADHLAQVDWDGFDALIVSGESLAAEPSRGAAFAALARARAAGQALILDLSCGVCSRAGALESMRRAARAVDFVSGHERDFDAMSGGEGLDFARALLSASAGLVLYKQGAKGAFAFARGETFYTPGFSVAAQRQSRAGEAFFAAFALGLAEERPSREAAVRAAAAAAIVVTRGGAAPEWPTTDELEAFLRAHPPLQVIES